MNAATPTPDLTPAEAMMLMDLRGASASGLFKVSAMALMLRRVIRAEAEVQRGWLRTRTVTRLRLGQVPALPPHEQAVTRLVHSAGQGEPRGPTVERVVAAARREHGDALAGYRQNLVLPALLGRRLVQVEASGWFKRERPVLTPAGAAALARLNAALDQGRQVLRWLDTDPRQAVLTAVALGPLVLLVEELRPHLSRLADATRRQDQGGDAGSGSSGSDTSDTSHHHDRDRGQHEHGQQMDGPSGFDFGAFDGAGLDAGAFDGLDSAMSSFDAATDGGSDSGGSGGGDSSGE